MNNKVRSILSAPSWDEVYRWQRRAVWALIFGFVAGVLVAAIVYALGRSIT